MAIARHTRLRPTIATGRQASGIKASIMSGCVTPHTNVCIAPMLVPITRRRCLTPRLSQQAPLCLDHVVVVVLRKVRVQPVARLARAAVTDAVRQHDPVARRVERRAGAIELVGELRAHELAAGAAGAVQDEHGIHDRALRVALRPAERQVVQPQFGQPLARTERELMQDDVALVRRVGRRCAAATACGNSITRTKA